MCSNSCNPAVGDRTGRERDDHMSSTKKVKLTLLREPKTADDIDALFKALTGSQVPMTEEERRKVEAILAEPPQGMTR